MLCQKRYFYSVFSKAQLLQRIRYKLQKTRKFTKHSGLCFSARKGVLKPSFLGSCLVLVSVLAFSLFFWTEAKQGISCSLEGFQNSIFLCQPLLRNIRVFLLPFLCCFPFPFLIVAFLLETNFSEMTFSDPKLFSCLVVWSFCCCFVVLF